MTEFLADDNVCGQNLLQIIAIGNAIIAELLRLKDYIPDVFRLETKEDQLKYSEIILDFHYFKISDAQDKKLEEDSDLQDLDESFRDNYIEILTRFYLAFESIHQYVINLKNFIQELSDGMYIQQTMENILQDDEGKQLLCESLYLYGVMLLIVDLHIPGIIRERILVSYHRYSAQKSHGDSNIDDVCKLLRSTGFVNSPDIKRIQNYPEDYFNRIPLDETFIEMVIGRLRSDDVYNQITVYPLPEHRSTALANQAAMLYICLYFSPRTLHTQNSRMREIVDKFFPDNWIVSIYMGITVNLIDTWDSYKAARMALANAIELDNVKELSKKHIQMMNSRLVPESRKLLKEGALNEQILIRNITKILTLLRELNVTLRWLMLHTTRSNIVYLSNKKSRQIQEQIANENEFQNIHLFELLLNTSQLELKLRDIIKELLAEKTTRWMDYRNESFERINELCDVFGGAKPLIKIEINDDLHNWFREICKEINSLNQDNPHVSGRKIIQLIQALEEVQEFHNLDTNMQVKQHLMETRQYLYQMIQTINIKEETLINIQLIGDLSYAWKCIDNYTAIMQESVKKQPNNVSKLRATFLKLASALEIPLLRINQAKSSDLISVSQYYSNELVNYVRKVVQIIPETMFEILAKIIHKQTEIINELPTRLEKDKLKEYAQLDERYLIAKLTYSISVFTEGILMMKTTLVGVIELDPKQLLEDGIRKELVKNLSNTLHTGLIFNATKSSKQSQQSELDIKLTALSKQIDGYRRSFEYVQDYLNIDGFKIWQTEMSRIMNYNVEKECNGFLRKKVQDWQSEYQVAAIPIPVFKPTDTLSVNFIGRLAREILRQTDPKTSIYVEMNHAWYDSKTSQKELLNMKFFSKITESIGPAGLIGLDRLYSHMLVADIQQLITKLQKNVMKEKLWMDTLNALASEITPNVIVIQQPIKFYGNYVSRCVKIWPYLMESIMKIGNKQILRKHIGYELNTSCKFNSKHLESSLRVLNDAILYEIKCNKLNAVKSPQTASQPPTSTTSTPSIELLCELNKYLEWTGIYDPLKKVYHPSKYFEYIPLLLFLFVIAHIPKFQFIKHLSLLMGRKPSSVTEHIDGTAFIIGLVTIFRQFPKMVTYSFLEYLSQYVTSTIEYNLSNKLEFGNDPQIGIYFLLLFCRTAGLTKDTLVPYIPEGILNQFEYLSTKL